MISDEKAAESKLNFQDIRCRYSLSIFEDQAFVTDVNFLYLSGYRTIGASGFLLIGLEIGKSYFWGQTEVFLKQRQLGIKNSFFIFVQVNYPLSKANGLPASQTS